MICMTPYWTQPKIGPKVPVPCGKCLPCVKRHAAQWSLRLMQEAKRSSSALFVTLTYAVKHVPITENRFLTLEPKHVTDFMKRLRKRTDEKIKYYVVGEYGEKQFRPHYHMILFNANEDDVVEEWKEYGDVHIGYVEGASIGYTLKYMHKKGRIPMHDRDDRHPEYARMSKGLGTNYLTEEKLQWHLKDLSNRMYSVTHEGYKVPLPRYYKERIFSDENFESAEQAKHVRKVSDMNAREKAMLKASQELEKMKGDPEHNALQLHLAMQHYRDEQSQLGGKI